MTDRRIAVLGAGAIGGSIAAFLARAGIDVTVIDIWPENVAEMRATGIRVTTQEGNYEARPAEALNLADVPLSARYDIVVLALKSYDTVWASHFIRPHLAPGGYIVSAQNSINEDAIAGVVGWGRVVGAVVTFGGGMYEPAHVIFTSPRERKPFTIGEPSGIITPRVREVVELLDNVSGGGVTATTNLWGERWSKLCVNSMANAVAGASGLRSAELREVAESRRVSIRIAAEVVSVGTACGVAIEPVTGVSAELYPRALVDGGVMEQVEGILVEGAHQVGVGRPSLAQDLAKGRPIEVDHLNGYVSRRGAEVGIPTPANDAIRSLVGRVAAGELEPAVENLAGIQ